MINHDQLSRCRGAQLIALLLFALCSGCSSNKGEPVQTAIEGFLLAEYNGDADRVWSLLSAEDKSALELRASKEGVASGKELLQKALPQPKEKRSGKPVLHIAEERQVHGVTQCLVQFPNSKATPRYFTLLKEEGGWKFCLSGCGDLPHYTPEKKAFLVQDGQNGQNGNDFVAHLQRIKTRAEQDQYVEKANRQTITVRGTIKEIAGGGFVGEPTFVVSIPEAQEGDAIASNVWITLDKTQFASAAYNFLDGKATFKHYDGRPQEVKKGDVMTVTGVIWGFKGRLEVADALLGK